MRKLTVKNFSVIKDAELEFGKITVLIGPQSSGKSLLCKLAYFMSKQAIDSAVEALMGGEPFERFSENIMKKFADWFPADTWQDIETFVEFRCGDFSIKIRKDSTKSIPWIQFSSQFETTFSGMIDLPNDSGGLISDYSSDRREQIRAKLNLLLTVADLENPFVYQSLFIPGGRAVFTNASLGFSTLQNPDIDPVIREFSTKIAWGDSWKLDPIIGPEAVQRLESIRREMVEIAGGNVEGRSTSARFRRFGDERQVPMTLLSSGTQELLPILNVLEQLMTSQRDRILFPRQNGLPGMQNRLIISKGLVYLEEPEANVFPSTQFSLTRLVAALSNERTLDFSWVITTHSPYILSAFNNLLEAWQTGHMDQQRAHAVRAVIDEKYWVNPDEFRAYAIQDGELRSIVADDTRLISENYLDSVSETIGAEFDELLRIGYVEA